MASDGSIFFYVFLVKILGGSILFLVNLGDTASWLCNVLFKLTISGDLKSLFLKSDLFSINSVNDINIKISIKNIKKVRYLNKDILCNKISILLSYSQNWSNISIGSHYFDNFCKIISA